MDDGAIADDEFAGRHAHRRGRPASVNAIRPAAPATAHHIEIHHGRPAFRR